MNLPPTLPRQGEGRRRTDPTRLPGAVAHQRSRGPEHDIGPIRDAGAVGPARDDPAGPTARDVMNCQPDRVAHTDTLTEVLRRMRHLLVAFLPVCGERDELHGIIALHDLRPAIEGGVDQTRVTAASLAAAPAVTVGVDDSAEHASHLMARYRVWMLPVLDGRRLAGVIQYRKHHPPVLPAAAPPPPIAREPGPDAPGLALERLRTSALNGNVAPNVTP